METNKNLQQIFFTSLFLFSFLIIGNVNGNNIPNTACQADFIYSDYEGPLPVVGAYTFENFSSGSYTNLVWDFGDGSIVSSADATMHVYEESGTYEVSLSIWEDYPQQCYSTVTKIVEVWISNDPCDQLDCVWPGDTNANGLANLEDVLNIGLEFGETGPPRDSVCGAWSPHSAADWESFTVDGVDLKHVDCNGDGVINLSDLPYTSNVSESYTRLEGGTSVADTDGAPIDLRFNVDTVRLTDSFTATEIFARIILGTGSIPVEDVYAVVMYLDFPGQYIDTNSQITFDYDEDSFMGGVGEVIPRAVDLSDQGQMDIVVARVNGENVSGSGEIGTVKFIIDADIIDGRAEEEGELFDVKLNVVKVIDKFGNELEISLAAEPASVFFVNNIVTSVVDPALSEKVKVYPNPVSEVLSIEMGELAGENLELFDVLGKQVHSQELQSDNVINLNVNRFEKGIYLMKIQTDQGLVSKRVVVK